MDSGLGATAGEQCARESKLGSTQTVVFRRSHGVAKNKYSNAMTPAVEREVLK